MRTIREFFSGRVILLTGGTGFLGKALIEKVLRDIPEVERIYALVRPRRRPDGTTQSAAERLRREVFETAIFSRLRQLHGERFWTFIQDKVKALPGDLTEDGLGIPAEDVERLRAEVDCVIHGAASVFFDERIDHAVQMNTLGPRRLIELTRTFHKPATFTFVSTAYVSGMRKGVIAEEPPAPDRSALELAGVKGAPPLDLDREMSEIVAVTAAVHASAASETALRRFRAEATADVAREDSEGGSVDERAGHLRDKWIERALVAEGMRRARRLGWHEVYTFTKAMGEAQVVVHRGDVPTAIVRPSIIESSLNEPEPGWINGLKVADPLIAGYAKGRIPDFPCEVDSVLDLIPVDFVANAILAATERLERERDFRVYHVATGARNPIRVGEIFELIQSYYRRHPMRDRKGEPIRVADWRFPSVKRFRARYHWGYLVPLRAAGAVVRATSFLPWREGFIDDLERGAEAVERLLYYTDIYSPYTNLACTFASGNTKALFDGLAPEDKARFPFDVETISWPVYVQDVHLSGLDRHVLRFGRSDGAGRGRRGAKAARTRVSTDDLRTIPDLLRLSADRFGDKVALQVKRDGAWSRLTYGDFHKRAGLMGVMLRRAGLRRGDRVVLMAENQPEWAIAHFAAQSVGVTAVAIDTHTPPLEVEQIVQFTAARGILTSRALYPALPKSIRSSPLPIWDITNHGFPFEERGAPAPAPPAADEVRWEELDPDDVASIIFTSGPAVEPRGVMLTHRNFLSNLLSLSEALRSYETDRFVSVLPLHHALEFTGGLLMPMFSGATVSYAQTLKSKVILDLIQETGATAVLAVPRIFEMLYDRLNRGAEESGGRESLGRSPEVVSFVNGVRLLVSGGAPLDYSIYEAFAEIGTPIHEGYGLTETSPILTVNPLWAIRPRSVGKALPGVELRIDRPDATGEGEIVVRGPNVMKGYYKNPEGTAKVLRDGWLYTGDLGRLDADGYLTITGRSKELIVTGAGKNVWPEEVELFYREVEGLEEFSVFGVREPGSTREMVHAAVVAKGDPEKVRDGINRISHERPTYQRIQHVHFWDTPLPRVPGTSRFDRKQLRDAVLEKLKTAKRTRRVAAVASTTAPWWEREALALIGRIAGRTPEEGVGIKEPLAQLLDSLQAVELLAALEGRFGATISDEDAASLRTVAEVLDRVKVATAGKSEPAAATEVDQPIGGDYWTRALASSEGSAEPAAGIKASPAILPLQSLAHATVHLGLRTAFRLSVRGADRLPRGVPYLIAANHSSHLDTAAMIAALRGRVARVHILGARDYFFDTPAKAWFFRNLLNVVPFDRDKNFVEGLRACRQVLRRDQPVLIFPEGTRSANGRLQPFKVGLGILALELGAPVVPARIRGTFEAMPKGARLPRLSRIDVAFGEPVDIEAYRDRRGKSTTYDLYREVVNEVRQRVEQLLEEA